MKMLPIIAVQKGSPAEIAGIKEGDLITGISGFEEIDPMALPEQLIPLAGQSLTITLQRGESAETVTKTVTLRKPTVFHAFHSKGKPIAVETLGVAYGVGREVSATWPGFPADGPLQKGDEIIRVDFIAANKDIAELETGSQKEEHFVTIGEDEINWPHIHYKLQTIFPTTKVKLTFKRGGQQKTVELVPQDAEDVFNPERRFIFKTLSEDHKVDSLGEAFSLGLRETGEGITQVVFVLYKLVSGGLSPTKLGGPGTIAVVAGAEASQGTSRLLVFLTLLSANLAVVNFLPIPVLDGGHVVFLTWELIFRKPMNERVMFGLQVVGLSFILALMLFVIGMDVYRLSGMAG